MSLIGGAHCFAIFSPAHLLFVTLQEEGEPADGKGDELQLAETARVAHFVAQFAVDLRKLLSASVQVPAPPPVTLPVAQSLAKQDEGEVDAIVAAATSASALATR